MHHTVCFWHQIFCFLFILVCVSCHLKKRVVLTKQAWEEEHIKNCSVHGSKGNVGSVGTDYHHLFKGTGDFFFLHIIIIHMHEMFIVKVQPT